MKTKLLVIGLVVLVAMMLTGCGQNVTLYKQAQQQYNQGNYESSFDTVVKSLKLKPGFVKAQALINEAYPKAVAEREANIQKLNATSDPGKYDKIVAEYAALDVIQTTARKLPPLADPKSGITVTFAYKDYVADWDSAKNNAAEYHYQNGIKIAANSTNVDVQKQAAKEFKTALTYVDNYKDASAKYDNCRSLGIKRIAIIPFDDKSGSNGKYGALNEMIVDGVYSGIMNDPSCTEFLEIITRDQIDILLREHNLNASGLVDASSAANFGKLLGVHEIMTGKISQIIFTPERTVSKDFSETANVKTGEEQYYDDKGKLKTKDVYGDVSCNYTKYTKTSSAKITGSYIIVDVETGKIKKQDQFTCEKPWADVWATKGYGDEKGLSKETYNLCTKSEPLAPVEADLVTEAMHDLTGNFVTQIKGYVQ
jgi:hypothetical protein